MRSTATSRGDHPRGCGAHIQVDRSMFRLQGSSPRMRGSHVMKRTVRAAQGIIPADAGLTRLSCSCDSRLRDHPRGCGAHRNKVAKNRSHWGSSPRMRGSLALLLRTAGGERIIPADAGLTPKLNLYRKAVRDHPRGCGAHTLRASLLRRSAGSSPRMRGSHTRYRAGRWKHGIIPADAGLTLLLRNG